MSSEPVAPKGSGTRLSRPSRLDHGVLEQLREMLAFAGPEAIRDIFQLYLDDVPRRIEALQRAVDEDDRDGLRRAAHGLRGCSASIGATRLTELCGALEETPEDVAAQVAGIVEESAWVERLVSREMERLAAELARASTG